jgi:hypothetical protein
MLVKTGNGEVVMVIEALITSNPTVYEYNRSLYLKYLLYNCTTGGDVL